ncbi:hypothetical protein CAPTEDRAFT_133977, partial [Capitella teleta]
MDVLCKKELGRIVRILMDKGANVNMGDTSGTTPLMYTIHLRDISIVKLFIENNADVNARAIKGSTALHNCVVKKDTYLHVNAKKSMDMLIKHGADVNIADNDGITPLYLATSYGHVCAMKKLLMNGADRNQQTRTGDTALHAA